MGARRKRFDDSTVEALVAPKAGRLELVDPNQLGLLLRVTPNGVKSWSVIYRIYGERRASLDGTQTRGAQHRLTLGRWPKLKVEDARNKARAHLELAASGKDPRAELDDAAERRRKMTVSALVPRFIADEKRTIASWRNSEFALRRLPSTWAIRQLADISRADVHELLDEVVATGKVGAARALREALRKLFGWAEDRDLVTRNPAAGLSRKDLARNPNAGRALDDAELRSTWLTARAMPYPFGPMFSLLLLSGARLNEIAGAQWSDVDERERTIRVPAERFKSRRDHLIVLSSVAWDILRTLPRFASGDCVFTSTNGKRPVSGFTRASNTLRFGAANLYRRETGDELMHFRAAHDLRVTCRTRLAELRVAPHIAEACLGHAPDALVATYNKSDLLLERREAMEAYARHVVKIVGSDAHR